LQEHGADALAHPGRRDRSLHVARHIERAAALGAEGERLLPAHVPSSRIPLRDRRAPCRPASAARNPSPTGSAARPCRYVAAAAPAYTSRPFPETCRACRRGARTLYTRIT